METLGKVAGLANVVWEMLPGGRFAFTTSEIEGTHPRSVRTFKNLPDFLGDQYADYFHLHAEKTWLVYEGERITFGAGWELITQVSQQVAQSSSLFFSCYLLSVAPAILCLNVHSADCVWSEWLNVE